MAKSNPQKFIAALSFALRAGDTAMQIFPCGEFNAPRGAMRGSGPWRMNAQAAAALIAQIGKLTNEIMVDYEHQSLLTAENGQKAPAAGWLARGGFEWREGEGFFHSAPVWTAAAKQHIDALEYRYVSAVFPYDPATGYPLDIISVALLNQPAIDDMRPLAAAAALKTPTQPIGKINMDEEILPELAWLLNVPPSSTLEQLRAALQSALSQLPGAPTAADMAAAATARKPFNLQGAIAALAAKAHQPDPAQFVPVGVLREVQQDLAALKTSLATERASTLIEAALAAGKIASPQKRTYANALAGLDPEGKPLAGTVANIAALKSYLDSEDPNPALIDNQTKGKTPEEIAALAAGTLTPTEIAICKSHGLNEADFLATKKKQAGVKS